MLKVEPGNARLALSAANLKLCPLLSLRPSATEPHLARRGSGVITSDSGLS